ncbi:hypothetical protein [Vibrio sp. TBV020]|uniref:hypothetical protein n=1 Tax=Vibrio sp. TBV020 TaxID=3137398 RepID=UPI0038CD507A
MRKIGCLTGAALIIAATSAPVLAEEPAATDLAVGMALDQELSVVVELDSTYRFTLGNDGAAFDYILKRGQFDANTPISWYVGVGGWSEWDHEEFGARVPLGLKWDISKGWEMYGQIHPELNLYTGPELQLGGALGIKYSF